MRNCIELKRPASLLHELGRGHTDAPAALFYRHHPGQLLISVSDSGIGFSGEAHIGETARYRAGF
jgi:hypothetical protein